KRPPSRPNVQTHRSQSKAARDASALSDTLFEVLGCRSSQVRVSPAARKRRHREGEFDDHNNQQHQLSTDLVTDRANEGRWTTVCGVATTGAPRADTPHTRPRTGGAGAVPRSRRRTSRLR